MGLGMRNGVIGEMRLESWDGAMRDGGVIATGVAAGLRHIY